MKPERTLGKVVRVVEDRVSGAGRIIEPVRESFFRKFPTTSLLLVTFGASATIYGFERTLSTWEWLNDRPLLIILVGVGTLMLTGRLYKKLG